MSAAVRPADEQQGQWATALLLFALLVPVYLLTYSGAFRVDDEHILAARAQSLALWGEFSNPQVYGNDRVRQLAGLAPVAAAQATGIEPAQTILGAGLYRLSLGLGVGGVQAMVTLNIYVVAATAVIVSLAVRRLGYQPGTAVWCGLLFGLATMAWPYSKTFYRDPLAMLMVSIAFFGWVMATRARAWAQAPGVAVMLLGTLGGVLAKNTAMVLLPAFGVTLLCAWVRQHGAGRRLWGRLTAAAVAAGSLVGLAALVFEQGPLARYSLTYLTSLARHFVAGLGPHSLIAALGPFLSPAKSLFLFSPPLVLSVIGGVRWWSRQRLVALPAALTALTLALAQALFYGEAWAGSFGWGLRYMLPALPPLMLVAAPAVEWVLQTDSPGPRWALAGLMVAGVLVQLSGAVVSWHAAYDRWQAAGLNPFRPASAWDTSFLAIPLQIAMLPQTGSWDLAWWRTLPLQPMGASILMAGTAGLATASLWLLLRVGQAPGRVARHAMAACLAALALALPLFPSLAVLRRDPAAAMHQPELQQALEWMEADLRPDDTVVVDSYGTPLWRFLMQRWSAPARWYSLPFEIPGAAGVGTEPGGQPSNAAIQLFWQVEGGGGRLWYLWSDQAPDSGLGREIAWLDREFLLLRARTWQGRTTLQARLYVGKGAGH